MGDDFIVDLWSQIKHLIPAKDRLDAADAIIRITDEYGHADGIELREDLDKELMAAVKSYYGSDDDYEDDYEH